MRKKNMFIFLVFFLMCHLIRADENRFRISILSGINHVFQYGSTEDYVMGENNFPVTSSHSAIGFGGGIAFFLNNRFHLELDGRYFLDTRMILEDPTDLDTVEVDSAKHYSLTLNLIYQLETGVIRPYAAFGGGIDKLLAEQYTMISSYGFEIEFPKPDRTFDPVVQFGGGTNVYLSSSFGLLVDIRYVLIFTDAETISSLNVMAGIFLIL